MYTSLCSINTDLPHEKIHKLNFCTTVHKMFEVNCSLGYEQIFSNI